ncbi:FeoB-associated Cys-rich membrane protein [Lachnospiraceae bacterium WCA-693-APC-MOT-I]|uniref:FeoB-associated Cys-rich membrane protein n=1 Tax=Velocimicrobium porci TaxID=2606634 RepID=A0A6L5XV21_9FIRM|nr:FeoB-associated Cys-rich membrane protein [Velocimicrobium porci]
MIEILVLLGIVSYSAWVVRKKISDIKNGKGCGCGCSGCSKPCSDREQKY